MSSKTTKWLMAGNMPYMAVVPLCAVFFALGVHWTSAPPRIALVERGAVVLEAVLAMPGATNEQLQSQIEAPTKAVLQKYHDAGYLVIDTSRDDAGRLAVAAVPESAIDITDELRIAIRANQPAANVAQP